MRSPRVKFRPTVAEDLPEAFEVFAVAQRELCERRGVRWTGREFSPWERIQLHVLHRDQSRCFVAEEAGRVVGFAAAWVSEDVWFLSALFVCPERQRQGIGKRLVDLVWGEEYARRITITEALQPVSTASYARRGLIPTTPVLRFEGQPLNRAPEQLEAAGPDPDALRVVDLAAYGFDRGADHALWSETAERATLWLVDGEPAAYSYVGPTGAIGPLAGRDETSAANALRNELDRCRGGAVSVAVPGSSAQLVDVALESGLRMEDPGLLLLLPPVDPPRKLAIHGDWLF
jgi:GNAT superfamily N-acetyltransferase